MLRLLGKKNQLSNMSDATGELDFQYLEDEAWYSVRLVLDEERERLIVKYCDFSDEEDDEVFSANDFKDSKQLEDFARRFRPCSVQLQDSECNKVVNGMTVSASFKFGRNNVKFFDAVVDSVDRKDHKFRGGEVCTCKFMLFWLAGPNLSLKSPTTVEHICLLQPIHAQTDPTLARFLKMSREKLTGDSQYVCPDFSTSPNRNADSTVEDRSGSLHCESHSAHSTEERSSKQSVSEGGKSKGQSAVHWETTGDDRDLGGRSTLTEYLGEGSSYHFILIENLEKDLHPSAIVDFINKNVSISSQAQLFPTLSSESYTRGYIVVDSEEELQKLADFLDDPAHIILSSRGRPWVMTEKKLRHGAVGATIGNLVTLSEWQPPDENLETGEEIKIFSRGTKEYKKGLQLRELFLKFADDHRSLHHLLALEERMILQSPNEP